MRVLLVNQDWFKEEFMAAGHEVVSAGLSQHLDYVAPIPLIPLNQLIDECMSGKRPDIILIHDNSAPMWIMHLADTDIPILFYSVDAHHHAELHANLGCVFDHLLVAQKDYIPLMQNTSDAKIEWMPLWSSIDVDTSDDYQHDTVFIGNLDKKLNPERVAFFEALQKEVPVYCAKGKWWEFFPFSQIVMNQTVKGDLNFRVFEAMMCGTLLITEKTRNGLFDLFQDGIHLVTYEKNNVQEAAEKIRYYLAHKEEAENIRKKGREEILAKHTRRHRADHFERLCLQMLGRKQSRNKKYLGWMYNCNVLARRLTDLDTALATQAWAYAFQAAESVVRNKEPLNEYYAYSFVTICCQFGLHHKRDLSVELLERAHQQYSGLLLVNLALVREYLNRGERDKAAQVATSISPEAAEKTFQNAEKAIMSLLESSDDGTDTP